MGFESEQAPVIDKDARHGDRYGRRTNADPGRCAGIFRWDRGTGFAVAALERNAFIARTVKRSGYGRLGRADKAVILRFLERDQQPPPATCVSIVFIRAIRSSVCRSVSIVSIPQFSRTYQLHHLLRAWLFLLWHLASHYDVFRYS